ncbi:MAG TPA: 50S ribosomal protein L25, partial [Phycisphaerae bacterium]|nr:50S ribosomal protein L25 [Phycisphaerae bacterium]
IYGHGEAPESVALSRRDLEQALARLSHVIALEREGKSTQYLIKDVQYDHLQKDPVHVDLMRVDPNERVHVKVPVEMKGTPVGIKAGGELSQLMTDLEVECRLLDIPNVIVVNVADLDLNHAIHVRELQLPEGVRALAEPEAAVAQVKLKRIAAEAAPTAPVEGAPAEPEVIGRVAKEEGPGEKN